MTDTVHGRYSFADFRLQNGEVLPEVTIAYATRGRLAPDGRNAVLVTHGYARELASEIAAERPDRLAAPAEGEHRRDREEHDEGGWDLICVMACDLRGGDPETCHRERQRPIPPRPWAPAEHVTHHLRTPPRQCC